MTNCLVTLFRPAHALRKSEELFSGREEFGENAYTQGAYMRVHSLLLSTSFLCAAMLATDTAALAQSNMEGLEVVTVTARRRVESIQETPVSVTAVSGAQLDRMMINNLADLTRKAPNFTIEGVGATSRSAGVVFSRGIGYSGVDAAIEPPVGIAIDDIFYSRNIGSLQSMYDVEQVQILLGPQGTLYGKNTTGGVLAIKTKDPGEQYELEAKLRYGNFGRENFFLAANVPLTDTLSARLAVNNVHSDGAFTNTYIDPATGLGKSNPSTGGDDTKAIRGKLKWTPNNNVTVVLTGQYFKQRQEGPAGTNGNVPGDALFTKGFSDVNSAVNGRPGVGSPGGPTDVYRINRDEDGIDNMDQAAVILNVDWKLDAFDITSVTGYLRDTTYNLNDFDGTDLNYFHSVTAEWGAGHNQFSQEVRFSSNDEESKLQWQGGIFYFNNRWQSSQYNLVGPSFAGNPGAPGNNPRTPLIIQRSATNGGGWTLAGFGQADYEVITNLTVTAGIRYTYETKYMNRWTNPTFAGTAKYSLGAGCGAGTCFGASADWTDINYHLNARYKLTPELMTYVSYSVGSKAGAFNSGAANVGVIGPAKPETAKAWEVGVKSEWFDNRLIANVAAFWNNYGDLQVSAFRPNPALPSGQETFLGNSAFVEAKGIEVQVTAIPFENLTLNGSVGYLDARYSSFVAALGYTFPGYGITCNQLIGGPGTPGVAQDHSVQGSPCYLVPQRAPQWTMKLEAAYDFTLPRDLGKLTPHVAWSYETSHYTQLLNAPQGRQSSYDKIDADITYQDVSGRYRVTLWGKNLTNTVNFLNSNAITNFFSQNYYMDPMTYGIELGVKFGGEK